MQQILYTLLGAAAIKLIDYIFIRGNIGLNEATAIRKELRSEVYKLKKEIGRLQTELMSWQKRYYELQAQYNELKVNYDELLLKYNDLQLDVEKSKLDILENQNQPVVMRIKSRESDRQRVVELGYGTSTHPTLCLGLC
jgi:chromosome segregation ATPase